MSLPRTPGNKADGAALWTALGAACAAQGDAIAAEDADRLDALLTEKERLLAALQAAPPATDPALRALMEEAQRSEACAEAALEKALLRFKEQLSATRARRAARQAFLSGGCSLPSPSPIPRFFDRHG